MACTVRCERHRDRRLHAQALSTLEYTLSQAPQDCEAACLQGALPALTAALGSEEPPVREAALQLLLQLVANSACTSYLLQVRCLGAAALVFVVVCCAAWAAVGACSRGMPLTAQLSSCRAAQQSTPTHHFISGLTAVH
jgi:hypothetical protein